MAALEAAHHDMRAALEALKGAPPPHDGADVPGRAALAAAAERVKAEAAKVGIMCGGAAPPADQLASLAAGLRDACVGFCACVHAASAGAGPSLKAELVKLASGVVTPCLLLVKQMVEGGTGAGGLRPMVWDGLAAASKAALDNKACLFKGLAGVMTVLQDVSREARPRRRGASAGAAQQGGAARARPGVDRAACRPRPQMTELQQEQQDRYGHAAPAAGAAAGGEGADGDDGAAGAAAAAPGPAGAAAPPAPRSPGSDSGEADSLDYEGGEMSGAERELLAACLALLAAATATLRAFGRALLRGPALPPGGEALDGWESCAFHARHLRRAAEDLGAAMYPPQVRAAPRPLRPRALAAAAAAAAAASIAAGAAEALPRSPPAQDFEEVGSAALAVFEVTELMADECPDADAVGAGELSALAAGLAAAHARVQAALGEAQAGANNEGSASDGGGA
ncbi:hypothetical protein HT031_003930 [Scenedesmus sp. PABB004]|nr:hypothetical protein HT031_003930 [Scenedesmus sp. PABB004]